MRIVHLSDIHFWRYALHPMRLMSKRLLGTASLLLGRGRRFRLERVPDLIERVQSLDADHLLITGDLTTTALADEFHHARTALAGLLEDAAKVTVIPGNHDRYTLRAHRSRRFERYFGAFAPEGPYPWLRQVDARTAILGLDPTRAGISASGKLPHSQLTAASDLVEASRDCVPLSGRCTTGVRSAACAQTNCELGRAVGVAADDRPPHLLLWPRARRLGVQAAVHSQPALLEPRCSVDA
jgi:hypothetical protein